MAPRAKGALALLGGVAGLALALPALGQQQSPQSILPPGFGEPARPAPAPQPAPPPPPATPGTVAVPTLPLAPPPSDDVVASDQSAAQTDADAAKAAAEAAAQALREQDVPDAARRPVDHIGFLTGDVTGISEDGFGATDGRFLATLMARLDAPIASRWLSMLLRRVLTTDVRTPAHVDPADWTAERALLLVRMGEANAARLLVQQLDTDHATPRYDDAVMQAGLATADPGALCPVADQAEAAIGTPVWSLARAMCAGLSGENGTALALYERARGMHDAPRGIDLQLAERVIGAGTNARRTVDIQWAQVDALTPWRFGLASAVGLTIPDTLLDGGGLALQGWRAYAPMLPIATRLAAERTAATLGVISAADLVDAYSEAAEDGDANAMDQTPGGLIRTAYAARDDADRLTAIKALWGDPASEREAYAGRILTARAAARIAPGDAAADQAPALLAAMLSAGLDIPAARWAGVARGLGGTAGQEARALLAVGAPGRIVALDGDAVSGFGSGGRGAARLRAQYLFAGLAGLGRISGATIAQLAGELGVPVSAANPWTRAIDGAAARGETATVVLIAAVGMQTNDWTQVSPAFLYHIILSLRAVGLEPEARMIAAEALSRT